MREETKPTWREIHGGFAKDMTLRDHFAGLAMQGFIANLESGDNIENLTSWCWGIADAMLAAREGK